MSTIPKERLEQLASGNAWYCVQDDEAAELARIALASLEAEPVAYIFKHPAGKLFWALTDESNKDQSDVIPVYAAAPASVVPDNASEPLAYAYKELTPEIMRNHLAVFERYGIAPNDSSTTIQALRIALDGIERSGAMLHGAKPVSQTYKLNELSGNSPVTPDGWISCSERMPEDTKMLLAFSQGEIVAAYWNWVVNPIDYKKYRAFTYLSGNILDDVTHWMPLPEPPL
ncbi:DUF551 domain-containing protein [Escherichia coli]|uniref:DUF551 domain-containing protein n=1 Tax=Escherichia coli TaxID=562 RepID=UPI0027E81626|nr:DUF551 domain-containing protein [Escherichia coli]MDT4744380.1 DUF551 domain-containing protein [Escherichia coli]HDU4198870.1 DUF551 domain-containing protein [Escherichia coli]HDX2321721.1 DUF551 domain-containing protein [Escherichia coli]HDX2833059.1 DUF551 domain-containing protein [Escherichia coli]